MSRFFTFLFGLVILSSSFILPQSTLAQTDTGIRFTTSPLPVTLSTKPGVPVTTELRVRNSGSHAEVFKVGLLTFKSSGSTGQPLLRERQAGDDFFDWVSFSPQQFPIAVNEWKTVKMTITPPASAAFGYYYAVTFSRADNASPQGGQTALLGSTAILVLLDVQSPNAKREVKISSFTTDRPWYEFLPTTFKLKLANTGNVHAAPFGTIFISQGSKQIGQISVNPAKGNILPQSSRDFTSQWTDGFPVYVEQVLNGKVVLDKNNQAVQQLTWNFSHADRLRVGQYTAHLVMAYDNGSRDVPLEATITFWVLPWRLVIAIILIPVIPAIFVYLIMRWRMNAWKSRETF